MSGPCRQSRSGTALRMTRARSTWVVVFLLLLVSPALVANAESDSTSPDSDPEGDITLGRIADEELSPSYPSGDEQESAENRIGGEDPSLNSVDNEPSSSGLDRGDTVPTYSEEEPAESKLGVEDPTPGYPEGETTHGVGYGHHLHPFYYQGDDEARRYSCALQGEWKPIIQGHGLHHDVLEDHGHLEEQASSLAVLQQLHPPAVVNKPPPPALLHLQQLHPPKIQQGQWLQGHPVQEDIKVVFEELPSQHGLQDLQGQQGHFELGLQSPLGLHGQLGHQTHHELHAVPSHHIPVKPNKIKPHFVNHVHQLQTGPVKFQEHNLLVPPPPPPQLPPRGFPWHNNKPSGAAHFKTNHLKYKHKYRPQYHTKEPVIIPLSDHATKQNFVNVHDKPPSFYAQLDHLKNSVILEHEQQLLQQQPSSHVEWKDDFLSIHQVVGSGGDSHAVGTEPELLSCTASGHYQVQDAASVFPASLSDHTAAHSEDAPVVLEQAEQAAARAPVIIPTQEAVPIQDVRPMKQPRGRSLPLPPTPSVRPAHFPRWPPRAPVRPAPQQYRGAIYTSSPRLERRTGSWPSNDIYNTYYPLYKVFVYREVS